MVGLLNQKSQNIEKRHVEYLIYVIHLLGFRQNAALEVVLDPMQREKYKEECQDVPRKEVAFAGGRRMKPQNAGYYHNVHAHVKGQSLLRVVLILRHAVGLQGEITHQVSQKKVHYQIHAAP
jgi:hypothetical protein